MRKSERPAGSLRRAVVFSVIPVLPQGFDAGAEVDVIRLPVQHERGNGFHSRLLGFGDAPFALAEVDDLHFEPRGVERGSNVLFGSDTDRAASVIEYGFGFHNLFS